MNALIADIFAAARYDFDRETTEKFQILAETLQTGAKKINLTAVSDAAGIAVLHFLDSLTVLERIADTDKNILDLGSGAGFPGLPLAIARPALRLTLLEARAKRAAFLREAADTLKLENVSVINARAEDAAASFAECFDAVLTRAVAKFALSAAYAMPFVKQNGRYLAMLGSAPQNDINAALPYLPALGGQITDVKTIVLPVINAGRAIVTVTKTAPQTAPAKKIIKAIKRGGIGGKA